HSGHRAISAPYVPGEIVVGYAPRPTAGLARAVSTRLGLRSAGLAEAGQQVLRLPAGESVQAAVARLRATPGVAYAVPNYLAHAAATQWVPDDPGRRGQPQGWTALQW